MCTVTYIVGAVLLTLRGREREERRQDDISLCVWGLERKGAERNENERKTRWTPGGTQPQCERRPATKTHPCPLAVQEEGNLVASCVLRRLRAAQLQEAGSR